MRRCLCTILGPGSGLESVFQSAQAFKSISWACLRVSQEPPLGRENGAPWPFPLVPTTVSLPSPGRHTESQKHRIIRVGEALQDPQAQPIPPWPLSTSLSATAPWILNISRDGDSPEHPKPALLKHIQTHLSS